MRILVVEDDPGIAEVLDYALRADGHAVHLVGKGSDALAAADDAECIVLDVGLPDFDGFEVCRRVRKTSDIPILFLTSRADEIDRVVGLELGADDYLTKPFSTRELLARIKAIMRRARTPAAAANSTLRAGLLVLDPDRHSALWEGRELGFTRIEFALLARLMGEPGRVYTRSQLLDHAWPDGGCVTDRTVDAHVKSLRRKLPEPELIETVRGVGYRFRDAGE